MSDAVNDDASDLAEAKTGDEHAFARLYDRHAAVVLSLCRQRITPSAGGLADAEDAMQETFIRAHRLLSRLNGATNLRPWLYAIARRICSERRRSANRRLTHETAAAQRFARELTAPAAEPDRNEAIARLDEAMQLLDDRQRLAIHLYYLEADPVVAAASALNLSRSGFYKLLSQARNRLKTLMREVQPS